MKSSYVHLKHKWQSWSFSLNTQKQNYWKTSSTIIVSVSKPHSRKNIDKYTWHRYFLISCMARVSKTLFHRMSYHKNIGFSKKKEKGKVTRHQTCNWWLPSSLNSVKWKDVFWYTLWFSSILSLSICRNSDFSPYQT